ncbi:MULTISPECIES: acetate kinase [Corynebacterium]|uniref:Acetate kinase n=1 Tax=Corynebacterium amycolatum TaxID=43765 RepID=A0AB38XVJ7_CORAY|nr:MULTISPECIES: acetate kinase [Corynebacterium]AIN81924.1 acetate kinase [Corynebacterium sp. ATCC 6931]KAA9289185.1 acetate kinase [Corynebacterium amycolatum]MBC6725691.1 acetate kinase [Corynebacterium amycolatum]MBC6759305.1 acetate kinase [Corynebacterium sp. LK24]MCG7245432.1 acetate kinase [Corynebacterium sp. ACRPX]
MSRHVLVLNSGSSSIKFQLVDPEKDSTQPPYVSGLVERIGEEDGIINLKFSGQKIEITEPIADHASGLDRAFELMDEHGVGPESVDIAAVGHRVVHGGRLFSGPELITDEIVGMIRDLIPLAPLHNPANIVGIEESRKLLPDVPHVAVFDTGFFHTMPPAAALYPLNAEVASKFDIRRYGFHGTSHEFVSKQVPDLLNKPAGEINQITLHLGNGASCAAIRGGQAVDTSMGLTPLAGLMMGTRTGDIDPGVIFHLYRNGMSIDEIDNLCNRQSGLKGVSGVNDFRVLQERMDDHDPDAWAAYQMYVHQLRRYIGSYMLILGRLDAITFTAGVGENHVGIRRDSMAELENFGIKIDDERNSQPNDGPRLISADDSKVKVFVVPTNEELAIARYAMSFVD